MMNLCYRNGLIPGMPLTGQPEPASMPANWQNNIPNNIYLKYSKDCSEGLKAV